MEELRSKEEQSSSRRKLRVGTVAYGWYVLTKGCMARRKLRLVKRNLRLGVVCLFCLFDSCELDLNDYKGKFKCIGVQFEV